MTNNTQLANKKQMGIACQPRYTLRSARGKLLAIHHISFAVSLGWFLARGLFDNSIEVLQAYLVDLPRVLP